jgi:hypothetical protein
VSINTQQTTLAFERHGSGAAIALTFDRRSGRPARWPAFLEFCDAATA